jgi:hypothetical protein
MMLRFLLYAGFNKSHVIRASIIFFFNFVSIHLRKISQLLASDSYYFMQMLVSKDEYGGLLKLRHPSVENY